MAISLRLGWWNDQLRPAGSGDPSTTPKSVILPHRSPDSGARLITTGGSGDPSTTPNSVILPHRSPDSGSFALILFNNRSISPYWSWSQIGKVA